MHTPRPSSLRHRWAVCRGVEKQGHTYLARSLDEGDVGFDPQGPGDVNCIFVELEQEDNKNKDSIHHSEGEDCQIPKLH